MNWCFQHGIAVAIATKCYLIILFLAYINKTCFFGLKCLNQNIVRTFVVFIAMLIQYTIEAVVDALLVKCIKKTLALKTNQDWYITIEAVWWIWLPEQNDSPSFVQNETFCCMHSRVNKVRFKFLHINHIYLWEPFSVRLPLPHCTGTCAERICPANLKDGVTFWSST